MAYVDLNPIRAALAATPEQSHHTSIQHWKQGVNGEAQGQASSDHSDHAFQSGDLHPFVGNLSQETPQGIIFNLVDYLELVDWTGRQIREDKIGSISAEAKPILQRHSISAKHWVYLCNKFEGTFKRLVGSVHSLKQACQQFKRKRRLNYSASAEFFT